MDMHPKSLAQLKKFLVVGMVLSRKHSRPELQHGCPFATISKVQTNGFFYGSAEGRRLWHGFQPEKDYVFDESGFTVNLGERFGSVRYGYPDAINRSED